MNQNHSDSQRTEKVLEFVESIFVKYGAVPVPEINEHSREAFGLRVYYERRDTYYRAEASSFDGKEVILICATNDPDEVRAGVDETIAAFPVSLPGEKMEREVLAALDIN